jgi:hypothetical protein
MAGRKLRTIPGMFSSRIGENRETGDSSQESVMALIDEFKLYPLPGALFVIAGF